METLDDDSQTIEIPDPTPPPPSAVDPEVESVFAELGFQSPSPGETEPPFLETLAPEPAAGAETLAMAEAGEDLGLGFEEGEEESPFAVGDFVWGKIKGGQQWWPGRVSELRRTDGHSVFVSYSGGGASSWCEPSQLRPLAAEFRRMAAQTKSKNFFAAVQAALDEVGRSNGKQLIASWSADEFLDWVKAVALDALAVDTLQVTMLRSWVAALEKECSPARRGVMELVDKIDLDELVMESVDDVKVSPEKLVSHRGKKKRSMAALIAEMDLDSVEVSDDDDDDDDDDDEGEQEEEGKSVGKKMKKKKRVKSEENESGVKEEETGSGRRERKKSKYLSPPYTYLSGGITKSLALSKNAEVGPRNSRGSAAAAAILKCTSEEVMTDEDEKKSPGFKMDSASTAEVLLEFLATAKNPVHLKWNRSARIVRGFFAVFRSSIYSDGAEFDAYQKQLANSVNVDGELANKEEACKSGEGKSERKRGRKRKDIANGEASEELSHADNKREVNGVSKRKMRKEEANGKIPANSEPQMVTVSVEGGSGYRKGQDKDSVNVEIVAPSGCSDASQMGQKVMKSKEIANGSTVTELNSESVKGKFGQKKRKSKDGHSGESPVNSGSTITKCSEENKSGTNKKKKDVTGCRNPTALLLTFSPGIALPSKDDLTSAFSKYGPLIESETELLEESSSAKVVFGKSADAEKAFNDKAGAFASPIATSRLRYLSENLRASSTPISVPKPPLPYIRRGLERMISSLSGTASPKIDVETSDELKPEARDNLLGEMQGLLKKVDKMLNSPAAGTSN